MPLKALRFKPGLNSDPTAYATEGQWRSGKNVRFRQGFPEKIGGSRRLFSRVFEGIARVLTPWVTLSGVRIYGVGTNSHYYTVRDGSFEDITPFYRVQVRANPLATTAGSPLVVVTDAAHTSLVDDRVVISGATLVGGVDLNGEYVIRRVIDANSYEIALQGNALATQTGGGATVTLAYPMPYGEEVALPRPGWGANTWSSGFWGGSGDVRRVGLWTSAYYGEDLVFASRGRELCYWRSSDPANTRGTIVANDVNQKAAPTKVNKVLVSDQSRFVLAFGSNEFGGTELDPMLVRWSAQENYLDWEPRADNQAGSIRLSLGSEIVAAVQARQEILVWTDVALYGMQYLGPPFVWSTQLLGDNISIISPSAAAVTPRGVFWMGVDKFYRFAGSVETLPCLVRDEVFNNLDFTQAVQVFAGTVEEFNEVWWFYVRKGARLPEQAVIYNYVDDAWTFATFTRTAWADRSAFNSRPVATAESLLVIHEEGYDDRGGFTRRALESYIESAPFDLDDGHHYGFVYRLLPDVTFSGTDDLDLNPGQPPSVTFGLRPYKNSGSGPHGSVGGAEAQPAIRTVTVPIEEYTGQVYIRVRGRQMTFRIESSAFGVFWRLGVPRIDIRQDGRAG